MLAPATIVQRIAWTMNRRPIVLKRDSWTANPRAETNTRKPILFINLLSTYRAKYIVNCLKQLFGQKMII